MEHRIWVIDDDAGSREVVARVLAGPGRTLVQLADGREALDRLRLEGPPDLVVSDIRMADVGGLEVADAFRREAPDTPIVLVTAFGNLDGAVEAIRRGAFDYISKPYEVDAVRLTAERALEQRRLATENRALRRELREKYRLENAVGQSEAMMGVFKTAARVAASDATVLVLGESGTGKELVARAIHGASPRAGGPFVPVDCGAMAESLLESELFGHVRGAFTGAHATRRGLFEEASGGTILLDEIGDIGAALQARLLRTLQEGTVRRVGSNEVIPVDVRVVAATNKDLEAAVAAGRFREDLFYRLNVVTLRIPPLRDRLEDVPFLAEHFAAKHGGPEAAVSREALAVLQRHDWPGNVRELENVVARALALNPSRVVVPADLPEALRGKAAVPATALTLPVGFRPTIDELVRQYAGLVLGEHGGNKTRAAEALGVDRKTLYRMLGED